jgi:hypothetical protein
MKLNTRVGLGIAIALLTLGLASAAFSQFGPPPGQGGQGGQDQGGSQPPRPPLRAVMHAGAQGVFVLEGPSITKYAAGTLDVKGTLQLAQKDAQAADAQQGMPPMGPPPPGAFVITGKDDGLLFVVLGDTVYKVDAAALTLISKTDLPAIEKPAQGQQPQGQGQRRGPQQGMRGQGGPGGQQGGPQGGQGGPGGQQGGPQGGQGGPGGQQGGPQGGQGGPGGQQGGPGMGGPGMGGPGGQMLPPAPELEVTGNYLYIQRGRQITAINIETGAVAGKTATAVTLQ